MTTTEDKPTLSPGFVVTVFGHDLDLRGATDIVATIVRPDETVVERPAVPFNERRIELALHEDDMVLPGRYLGEVSLNLDGDRHVFSPAFELLYHQQRPND